MAAISPENSMPLWAFIIIESSKQNLLYEKE